MKPIKSVAAREDFRVEVLLENGSSVILNMKKRLENIRFGRLSDQTFFQKVTTDGIFIQWDSGVEISCSEVFQLAQK